MVLEMKIPGDRWKDRKKGNLLGLHLQGSIVRAAGLIKINKIRIEMIVNIVNTKHPTAMNFFIWFECWRVRCGKIEAMIIWQTILIYFAVLLCEHALYNIKLRW